MIFDLSRLAGDRKLRLFSCACARSMWDKLTVPARASVLVAERYADGSATRRELDQASYGLGCCHTGACEAVEMVVEGRYFPAPSADTQAAIFDCLAGPDPAVALCGGARHSTAAEILESRQHAVGGGCCDRFADQMSCDCLEVARRGCDTCARILRWNDSTVLRIAAAVYEKGDWGMVGVLADALEEGGCPATVKCQRCGGEGWSSDWSGAAGSSKCYHCERGRAPNPVLLHLRGAGPHFRGCFCVDLILGKS